MAVLASLRSLELSGNTRRHLPWEQLTDQPWQRMRSVLHFNKDLQEVFRIKTIAKTRDSLCMMIDTKDSKQATANMMNSCQNQRIAIKMHQEAQETLSKISQRNQNEEMLVSCCYPRQMQNLIKLSLLKTFSPCRMLTSICFLSNLQRHAEMKGITTTVMILKVEVKATQLSRKQLLKTKLLLKQSSSSRANSSFCLSIKTRHQRIR